MSSPSEPQSLEAQLVALEALHARVRHAEAAYLQSSSARCIDGQPTQPEGVLSLESVLATEEKPELARSPESLPSQVVHAQQDPLQLAPFQVDGVQRVSSETLLGQAAIAQQDIVQSPASEVADAQPVSPPSSPSQVADAQPVSLSSLLAQATIAQPEPLQSSHSQVAGPQTASLQSSSDTPRSEPRVFTRRAPGDFGARLATARSMRPEDAPLLPPRTTEALAATYGGTSLCSPEIAQVVGTGTVVDAAPKRVINISEDATDQIILQGPLRLIRSEAVNKRETHPGMKEVLGWLDDHMPVELQQAVASDALVPGVVYAVKIPMREEEVANYYQLIPHFPSARDLQNLLAGGKENLDFVTADLQDAEGMRTWPQLTVPNQSLEQMLAGMVKSRRLGIPWDWARTTYRPEYFPVEYNAGGSLVDYKG